MPTRFWSNGRWASLVVLWLLFSTGCGSNGSREVKRVPLSGRVTIGDKPLKGCKVHFDPDESKGNMARSAPAGTLNSEGQYTISSKAVVRSDAGPGLPVGWYRVWIGATPGTEVPPEVDMKYLNFDTTTLLIEVVENPEPGQYDFDLSKH